MPRTKISKSSKRNREDAQREDKIREFDSSLDDFQMKLESKGQEDINEVANKLRMFVQRTNTNLLEMTIENYFKLSKDSPDWAQTPNLLGLSRASSQSTIYDSVLTTASSMLPSIKVPNPNDEGYLTEDSCNSGGKISMGQKLLMDFALASRSQNHSDQQCGRTPGPLSSARSRRPRRSRSACGDYVVHGSIIKPKTTSISSGTEQHASRSKIRTPVASRTKALSADRTYQQSLKGSCNDAINSPGSPAAAFMRWPKPGEMVLSMCGSPVVAQVLPDRFANVNIPVKNGVLSLRPKKLDNLQMDIISALKPETLIEIKTLQESLDLIMNMAKK